MSYSLGCAETCFYMSACFLHHVPPFVTKIIPATAVSLDSSKTD